MTHLDEGTMHAWLDGALDATQSAGVDAHVKSCTECAARVAEARGLIAASSRILTALDDVPANVTPKRAVAPVRRRRSITPWVSGLAAAVVLVTVWRTGGVEQPTPRPEIRIPEITTVRVAEPALADAAKLAAPPATTPSRPPQQKASGTTLPQPSAPRPTDPALRQLEAPQANVGGAPGAGAGGETVRLRRAASNDLTAADEARRALRPLPSSPVAGFEERKEDFSVRLAGCYRLPSERSLSDVVATAVGAASSVAKARAGAPAAAPSAQVAAKDAPLSLIRLDTTVAPDGYVLRDATTEMARGVWTAINRDSARVTLSAGTTLVLASLDQVPCPDR